jgi:hypothetical protein
LLALQAAPPAAPRDDVVQPHDVTVAPAADARLDTIAWGPPQVTIPTRQGRASVWLLRAADTVFVAARVPDRSESWADAISICLDVAGDRADAPAHDDFLFELRRVLDSSVVYRGRGGRWQPPLDDPDWRLGAKHAGGGWEAATASDPSGWSLVLRLDPAWLAGGAGARPGVAFVIHDNDPNGWFGWPSAERAGPPNALDLAPDRWIPVIAPR